jgi:hypothetical protein
MSQKEEAGGGTRGSRLPREGEAAASLYDTPEEWLATARRLVEDRA